MSAHTELTDAELMARCLEKDAEAWETLVRRYQRLIASITCKFKLSAEDSADVLQAVCLILFQQMAGLKKDAKLSSWLITVTVRECWKLRERSKNTELMSDEDLERAAKLPSQEQVLRTEELLQLEQQQLLRQGLAQLSEPCRRLLEHLFYREPPTSYAEISRQLAMPVASIGPTRARCLEKLKTTLKQIGLF
jgi:RNA polymerase sigma factor (sigma-70 family)